ncbi:MAG: phosphatase [Marmoricola sp.]|nr:phosphatase [Marmoricola sp.]
MKPMRIDLHTHSNCSDGTDNPADLIAKAAQAGLDVVALTDHDTTVGWAPAMAAAEHHAIHLVRGMEISTRNQGQGQHLLGYGFDPQRPALIEMLRRGNEGREGRIPAILERLRAHGIDLDEAAVWAGAKADGSIGRPHIADVMVREGHVADRGAAFTEYLVPGAKAYVERYAPDIIEAIGVIADAGGVTVIAHPRGRNSTVPLKRFDELKAAGLNGIEVDHQEHGVEARAELRQIATELDLVITGSSDHHGTAKLDHDLGCNTTAQDQYERLMAGVRHGPL